MVTLCLLKMEIEMIEKRLNNISIAFSKCIRWFYILSMSKIIGIIAALIILWIFLKILNRNNCRGWSHFNIILHILSILFIIRMTLVGRETGKREVELLPFYTLTTIAYNNEAIRTLVMNVILFVPFGLTVPYILEKKIKNSHLRWKTCILIACIMSILIESLQYFLGIGRAEIDDVICNTLGCSLGVLADMVAFFMMNYRQNRHSGKGMN